MQAVILVGGAGTRLRPLTIGTPKPLVPLLNRPFLIYQIELLKKHGIIDIIFSLSYLPQVIQEFFGTGEKWGVKINYSVEEEPLGTAGALKNTEEFLSSPPIIVFNGDILTDLDLSQFIQFHYKKKARATIALVPVEDPSLYGLVALDDNERVLKFVEKPIAEEIEQIGNLINAGVYALEREVLTYVPPKRYFSFERELFPILLQRGEPFFGYRTSTYWLDIGTPEKYKKAHQDILEERLKVKIESPHKSKGKVWIGANPAIAPGARFMGPIIIGDNCQIESEVEIAPFTVIGNNCRIERGAKISASLIWDDALIGAEAKLVDCIVGKKCKIGERAVVASGTILGDGSIVKEYSRLGGG